MIGTQTALCDNTYVITVYLVSLLLAFSLPSNNPHTCIFLTSSSQSGPPHLHISLALSVFSFFLPPFFLSSMLCVPLIPHFPHSVSLCVIHAFTPPLPPRSPPPLPSRAIQCGRVGDDVRDAAAGVSNSSVHI